MLHHRNVSTGIDHLGKLSRAELRVLWEREFPRRPLRRSGATFSRSALPMLGRSGATAG